MTSVFSYKQIKKKWIKQVQSNQSFCDIIFYVNVLACKINYLQTITELNTFTRSDFIISYSQFSFFCYF